MVPVQVSDLERNEIYKVVFLNGSELIVKFVGIKGQFTGINNERYYFLAKDGQEFSFATSTIGHIRFYKC